jgi:hypothetical protein
MTIKDLIRKLRTAADALEDVLGIDRATLLETPEVADKIRKTFKYRAGTHWTQKPENKAKLKKLARKGHKAMAAKIHWTQNPKFRGKLLKIRRAAALKRMKATAEKERMSA